MNKAMILITLLSLSASAGAAQMSLDDYKKAAMSNNHEIVELTYEAESASQAKKAAFTSYFPKLSGAVGGTNSDVFPGINAPVNFLPATAVSNGASVAELSLVQPVFAGGRIMNGNRLAETGAEAARYKLQIKKNEVETESEKKYRTLQVLEGKMKTLLSYERMMDALYSQVSDAESRGVVTKNDLLRVTLKKREIQVKKDQLAKLIDIAAKDMKIYAGIPSGYAAELSEDKSAVEEPEISSGAFRGLVKNRPEYKLLEAGVKAAELSKKIKTGSYMPSVSAGISVFKVNYYRDNHFSESASSYRDTAVFGIISVPISDWWEASHAVRDMKYKESSAREKLDSLGKYLVLDMENKKQAYETAYEQVLLAEISIEQAAANRSEAEDGYKNGTEKLSDYLEAIAMETESENKMLEARSDYFVSRTAFSITVRGN